MKKGVPLARKTPMSRARMKAKTLDPAASLGYAASREAILARSGGRCEICTCRLTLATLHAHHRRSRSAGRRDDGPANLVACCGPCHNGSNYSLHANPLNAVAHGRIISRHDRRAPSQIPVSLASGWCLLGDDGRRVPLPAWTPGP